MFDKDDSGRIDEEEFHFLLKYLNIEIDEDTHEKMFLKYDLDKSGFIEYPEFKKAWLRLANTRKELEDRGIDVPTLATRFQMINMLEKTLEEEEKQEKLAIEETKRWRRNQERLKLKREYILKAKHQAKVELCNALDAGGSVCVFGNGTLDQFTKTPRKNMNTSFFHQEGYDLLTSLWNLRVGGRSSNEYSNSSGGKVPSVKDDLELNMEGGEGSGNMKGFVHFDKGLNIQRNTVWLWGRQCKGVAISESVILAYCQGGSLYSWGGVDQWWHQLEAESCWQTRTRGEMTARSSDLLGCPIDSRSESFPASDHSSRYDPNKYMSESDELSRKIKTVLQYYNMWSIPDGLVDLLDHAKKCLRNNVERQRVAKSLHLRGKATENLTKMEMVKILYNDIMLEHKLLGEPAHLELRELEREVVELIQQRKLKLAKRRQYKFMEKWRLLGEAQRLDAKNISGGIDNESEIRINSPNDSKHSAMVKRLKDQDEVDLESLMTGEIVISGITPRGPRPKTVPPTSQWKMIDAGSNHAGILDNKDRLHMWGLNATGRLGLVEFKEEVTESKTLQKFHPKAIDLPNVRQFSCGHSHTAAVNTDGDLFLWGSASCGKLGLGDVTSRQECYSPIPMQLKNLSSKKITVVSCGASHTACVESEGGLFVWGNGGGGRLGLGHRRDVLAPMLVKTIQERIVSVSCGNCQTLAITAIDRSTEICNQSKVETVTGGKLYVAGPAEVLGASYSTFDIYESFSLGIDGTQTINPPIIDQISAGFSHQSAISIDGELFLWGDNTKGCCGQDDTKAHFISIPTRVNLYTKPKDLAAGRPTMRRSVSYGNQPFFDIDLDQVAAIREIKLWNCLKVPDNPAIKKKTFTGRLFPCWIMIAHEPFPESVGEGQLEAALKFSIAKKRFDQNLHESIWCRKLQFVYLICFSMITLLFLKNFTIITQARTHTRIIFNIH